MTSVFEVDRKGLAQILARRGKEFILLELIQNALDESVSRVVVRLEHIEGTKRHRLSVLDDSPDGFQDLAQSYTLFAPSKKKGDPEKRGRFNIGEKLVLAMCREASITSTTGHVQFDMEKGVRSRSRVPRTPEGTMFVGELVMSKAEAEHALDLARHVIVPEHVDLLIGAGSVKPRPRLASVTATLPTEVADEDGNLRRTERKTKIDVYAPLGGASPHLYEMGIPVVEFDCPWDISVAQKIPLNMDRDGVTPAYGRRVKTLVLNAMKDVLDDEESRAPWVGEALRDPNVTDEAVEAVIAARYGEDRVIADPSDPEGTKLAVSRGYTVIPAGSFDKEQWASIKRSGAALPAGQVTPSPKPYSDDGDPLKLIERDRWTPKMKEFEAYALDLAQALIGTRIHVDIASDLALSASATFGKSGRLVVNLARLGHAWFDRIGEHTDRLLIHEFAHYRVSDHLSSEYHEELCRLAAQMVSLALDDPGRLRVYRR